MERWGYRVSEAGARPRLKLVVVVVALVVALDRKSVV